MMNTPARLMGNGEGFTTLILTGEESRLIREHIENIEQLTNDPYSKWATEISAAFNQGIQRATDRIKAEFDQEQKARKALKSDQA